MLNTCGLPWWLWIRVIWKLNFGVGETDKENEEARKKVRGHEN